MKIARVSVTTVSEEAGSISVHIPPRKEKSV